MIAEITDAIEANERARFIIRLHINAPYWWCRDNPDECVLYRTLSGDKAAVDDHYENTGDLSVICQKQNNSYDIILVRCDVADALEGMQLVSKYKVNDKKVETPTVLISEPPRYTSELALAELVTSIAKKLNK